jgi:D-3-phosphoglycerate dehydrogenase
MDLLIAEPLEAEVLQWLDARHDVVYMPRLVDDRVALLGALTQARAVMLPASVRVDARLLQQSPMLRAIGRIVGGSENIDQPACAKAQIEVVRCTDATAPAEAEFMLGGLLSLLRPSPTEMGRVSGRELGRSTVGLVGLTAGAQRLGQLLRAMGSKVLAYDPGTHASDPRWAERDIEPTSLRELFESSDAVCVQLNYFSRYRGLLGERSLAHCKSGQVLLATSSSAVFDEATLARVLGSGRMAAAWLDQADLHLQAPGRILHGVPGLLITPRLAGYTRESRLRSAWGVARRIDEVLRLAPANARTGTRQLARTHASAAPSREPRAPFGLTPGADAAAGASPASP